VDNKDIVPVISFATPLTQKQTMPFGDRE
jgi:hypothetical protein